MKKWDDGGLGNNALKNQFTSYLQVAIRHSRISLLYSIFSAAVNILVLINRHVQNSVHYP